MFLMVELGRIGKDRGEAGYSFVACLSPSTIDHASLSRRSTVPTPNEDASNIWALTAFFQYITLKKKKKKITPFLFSPFVTTIYNTIAIVFSSSSVIVY